MSPWPIIAADCLDAMRDMEPESIDAIVTDPPYGLEFMGKEWDRLEGGFSDGTFKQFRLPSITGSKRNVKCDDCGRWAYDHPGRKCECGGTVRQKQRTMQDWHQAWAREALRVAKPGAYLLAFGGTRTVHRMTCALEDAGWIIRDMLVWAYAQGFPKSKASLKPAWEPIVMARKPGPLRELNIEACRISFAGDDDEAGAKGKNQHTRYANPGSNRDSYSGHMPARRDYTAPGRWPANLILTDPIFDGDVPGVVGGGRDLSQTATYEADPENVGYGGLPPRMAGTTVGYGDSGTYSRFFLVPKASRRDREPVLGGLPKRVVKIGGQEGHKINPTTGRPVVDPPRMNTHPTVKPTALMRHLVRLVTPPGGTVLDPFLGSGTTALACEMEGFAWVGIEREAEYVAIAEARLRGIDRGLGLSA